MAAPPIDFEMADSLGAEVNAHPTWVEKMAAQLQTEESTVQSGENHGRNYSGVSSKDRKGNDGAWIALGTIGLGAWWVRRYAKRRKRKANRKDKKDFSDVIRAILNVLAIVLILAFALLIPPLFGSIMLGLPAMVFGDLVLSYLFSILFSFVLVGLANLVLFLILPRDEDNFLPHLFFTILIFIPIAFLVGPFSLMFFFQWLLSINIGFGIGLLLSLSAAVIYLLSIGLITTTGLS